MTEASPKRFACDVMLGKLARELRMLGIDVHYDRTHSGMAAYRTARTKGRLFLTRSSRLRRLPGVVFVESNDPKEQLEQVKKLAGIGTREPPANRCLSCNEVLEKITREQARPSVPFYIYQIHHDFSRCPRCGRVFWPGTHVQQMRKGLGSSKSSQMRNTKEV
ncbi:MAG: Mut7-C RNAse domain-containing protein [candidate division WOR-3 bacterium]